MGPEMTLKAWMIIAIELLLSAFIITVLCGKINAEGQRADKAQSLATERQQTIDDMQVRQRDVAALDAKYTKELADAQATIDLLHDDVATGKRRLQLNAKCPANNSTGTTGVDDANSPRLADAAERNYWTLRSRIEIAGKQIAGLQQYINEQCLK